MEGKGERESGGGGWWWKEAWAARKRPEESRVRVSWDAMGDAQKKSEH